MTRKNFIRNAGMGALSVATLGGQKLTSPALTEVNNNDYSMAFGLARSLRTELSYSPVVEGKIPMQLNGSLYRNGPGLFERDGYRKANILDGDGMVQAFHFDRGKVNYLNRFIQTTKWREEELAGKYIYNTWTTRRPGGAFRNAFLQGKFGNQAGVTVRVFNERLFAFDESNLPYELDPLSLETLSGELDFGVHFDDSETVFAAHSQVDQHTGNWIQFGLSNGPKPRLQLSLFDPAMHVTRKREYQLPSATYMHDFFVTENYIVFNLQPAQMNLFSFVLGIDSFAESLRWEASRGSTIMVVDKRLENAPRFLETEAFFMWHSINAYEKGGEIFLLMPGYDEPDHFIGHHAQTYEIMKPGATPTSITPAAHPGTIRQLRINLRTNRIRQEVISPLTGASYEFPVMNERMQGFEYDLAYLAKGSQNGAFHHVVSKYDLVSGQEEVFDFGEGMYSGEPIFVADKTRSRRLVSSTEPGWIMVMVYDEKSDKSFLAILDSEHVSDGPVAKLHLQHHAPMSFHGTWHDRA